ncbi:Alpha/Beta hydrolase protein [Plectosphaerella plurivora]|uniref:Alpha/Beta hydrolase protein n=1 Tax=Plectosphaerella plurivora TaxID=936078 RepID=A0A9P9AEL8_9PEZI|nr:Alpha/Beta hydrolase protein [Plectosphaerella plurivora]
MFFRTLIITALVGSLAHALDRFVQNGDVRVHYQVSGQGPLLVLLHGFPDNSDTWSEQVAFFEKSYTVVRPTLRGFPPSDIPEVTEEAYTMPTVIGDVIAILDEFQVEKAIIGGHDFGGAAIQLLTILHPERVEGLIIINSPILPRFYDLVNHDKDQQETSDYTIPYINFKAGDDKNVDVVVQPIQDEAYRDEIREYLNESPMEGMYAYYKFNYPGPPYGANVDTSVMLYQVPTLIIWGLDDEFFSRKMLDSLPNFFMDTVRLVTLPGVGHWSFREEADRVNAEISSWLRFLRTRHTCAR